MPISSWVLTLSPNEATTAHALEALAGDARVTMGPRTGDRAPMVLDTATPEEDAALCRTVQALPGVSSLVLVMVDFSDVDHFDRQAFGAATARRTSTMTEVQP